jgi:glycosyltransferase involved in cell wall biosynthesis
MNRLRIAVFHDLPSGGAKRALQKQVQGLITLGHHVDAFIPSTAEERFLPLAEVTQLTRVFLRSPQPDREQALERGPNPADAIRWLRYLAGVRRSEREIAAAIDAGGHDAVLVAASQFTQAPWLLRWLRTPTVYYCQEPLRAAYEPRIAPPVTRFAIRHTLGHLDRANARAATVTAVNSRFSASRIEAAYSRPVQVNYLGVDAERFRPLPLPRDAFILTVAALHPLKGLDFLVDALGRMAPECRPPLVVVSDRSRPAERQRLEASAARGGVQLDFRFRVPDEELVRLYNQARVVVYAPYNEPFGFVPLEAMACGRPVLGVREGGIPETVIEGKTGFLAERDPDHFAARLTELLASPQQGERVAEQAVGIVRERWSWERSVAELAELLRHAAATGHSG